MGAARHQSHGTAGRCRSLEELATNTVLATSSDMLILRPQRLARPRWCVYAEEGGHGDGYLPFREEKSRVLAIDAGGEIGATV
jgi:hypothetical protein